MARRDQRLLKRILHIVKRAEHAIAVHVQLVGMAIDELPEARLISRLGALDRAR